MKINYFNFKPWKNKWLITNEQGRYAIVPNEEFQNLIHGRYEQISEEFLEELKGSTLFLMKMKMCLWSG